MAATLKYSLVSGFLAKINEPLKQSEWNLVRIYIILFAYDMLWKSTTVNVAKAENIEVMSDKFSVQRIWALVAQASSAE
jgi:hypothetical protein